VNTLILFMIINNR